MDNTRRNQLDMLRDQLEEIKETIETIKEEEEKYRDNIPENLHETEFYERAEITCEELCEAVDNIDMAIDNLENAVE